MISAVVGLNWGDEGKGRMVDYFAKDADCVIRFQGGDNAGHTVINDLGKFAFHNFPSGICYDNIINIIAPGSVINLESFIKEQKEIQAKGLDAENIVISDRATLILPFHYLLEKAEEERLKDKKYGSTMSGIAPTYGHKYLKKGIQAGELLYPEYLKEHLQDVIDYVNLSLTKGYGLEAVTFEETWAWIEKYSKLVKPYIKNIMPIINNMINKGKSIFVEAQLGALRDITHGIYPYTTSSSTIAGYACSSIPIPGTLMNNIVGVTKAYSTCVGEGPFVTELDGTLADTIRKIGKEYGAKTGRPRRIGHFDAVATRYGIKLQGATSMVVTCLDVLDTLSSLKICTSYNIDGKITSDFPLNPGLNKAKAEYIEVPGWQEDITQVRTYEDLPVNAKKYIEKIEYYTGLAVKYISVGPDREALIIRD